MPPSLEEQACHIPDTQAMTSAPAALSSSCKATNPGKCFSLHAQAVRQGSVLRAVVVINVVVIHTPLACRSR